MKVCGSNVNPLAVSATEAAKLLGVSRATIYELLRNNAFPSFHIGTRRLIPVAGLQNWVASQSGLDTSATVAEPLRIRHTER